ncbi:hypothetical protein MSZK_54510 [Mycobacterium sp. shizuoka-1]|nr:hypothetical protein MSZK_54510 [Mycobacterium sp. shizuoka-1]
MLALEELDELDDDSLELEDFSELDDEEDSDLPVLLVESRLSVR